MGKQSHVEQLVARYARGRSVREIERDNNLTQGALANFLKPSRGRGLVHIQVMERFANALGVTLKEASQAFVWDAGLGDDAYTDEEVELVSSYRALNPEDQERLRAIADAFLRLAHSTKVPAAPNG